MSVRLAQISVPKSATAIATRVACCMNLVRDRSRVSGVTQARKLNRSTPKWLQNCRKYSLIQTFQCLKFFPEPASSPHEKTFVNSAVANMGNHHFVITVTYITEK
ncbi:hypothetical protein Pla100_21660 [Neorhodopirellula pilleata]|uniref:Uncharacterized protein n=1 Tax=Neorhodopirellula pilleata TaxID=2714738 RepID=A0A5C6AHA4_9BACT|nr:hypothetical protein Pla100_21660 [Neorhodopirellula pilleata]